MKLNKLTAADIAYLGERFGANALFGKDISEDYSHDELGGAHGYPEALIKVGSAQDISFVMQYADEKHIPVVVRGSGTGLVGGCVAIEGGIMLDTTAMTKIIELDTQNLTVTVECGVLLMDLTEYVENAGFFYPPDPGEKSATIGGNISTNAGGMRAVKYGTTRDYVRALKAVLPGGEIVELGGKVVKNSTGYGLKELIIGSEGTLAVIAEATLKLLPLPSKSVSLLIPFETMEQAIEAVPGIIRLKAIPTAIEYMCRETILFAESYLGKKFPDTQSEAYLLLTFDGNDLVQIEQEYEPVADYCLDNGAKEVYIIDTEERKTSVWTARGAFLEAIKASTDCMDECDVVVPRSRIADFIKFTHELSQQLKVRIPSFGHAGDGNLHIYICRDGMNEDDWQNTLNAAFDALYAKAADMSGLVSGEHGVGYAKKGYMAQQLGSTQLGLMRGIKQAFDPNGILNPGKIC